MSKTSKSADKGELLDLRLDLVGSMTRLAEITVPSESPHPPVKIEVGDPNMMFVPAHLAYDLQWHTVLLAELAIDKKGRYEEGIEVPADCAAISTSTILMATSTIETYLNETISIHSKHNRRRGAIELFEKGLMEQTILTRLESVFRELGIEVDWSKEPFQSLKLLFTVRNSIVHHEGKDRVVVAKGYYRVNALKAVVAKIKSPYEDDPQSPYHWFTHVLTPNGAVWETNTMLEIVSLIDAELDAES